MDGGWRPRFTCKENQAQSREESGVWGRRKRGWSLEKLLSGISNDQQVRY